MKDQSNSTRTNVAGVVCSDGKHICKGLQKQFNSKKLFDLLNENIRRDDVELEAIEIIKSEFGVDPNYSSPRFPGKAGSLNEEVALVHLAAAQGMKQVLYELFKSGVDMRVLTHPYKHDLLQVAVKHQQKEMVEYLLDTFYLYPLRGINFYHVDACRENVFHLAARLKSKEIFEILTADLRSHSGDQNQESNGPTSSINGLDTAAMRGANSFGISF